MSLQCINTSVAIAGLTIVEDFQLEIKPGEFWGLLGPNGVGKTTLLHTLAGLRPVEKGLVQLDNKEINTAPRRWVAQRLGLLLQHTQYVFDATVLQTAMIGRHPYLGFWQSESPQDRQQAKSALADMGLEALESRSVTTLSGGEARRLAMATLLVQDPATMLLDEPTNHLDLQHQTWVMAMLKQACKNRGKGIVAALHDVNLAAQWCNHVLMLFGDGQCLQGSVHDLLTPEHLSRLYQQPIEQVATSGGFRFFPRAC